MSSNGCTVFNLANGSFPLRWNFDPMKMEGGVKTIEIHIAFSVLYAMSFKEILHGTRENMNVESKLP